MLPLLATHAKHIPTQQPREGLKRPTGTTAGGAGKARLASAGPAFHPPFPGEDAQMRGQKSPLPRSHTSWGGGAWHCHWGLQTRPPGTVSRSSRGCDPRNFISLGLQSRYPVFAPGVCRADSHVGWKMSVKPRLQILKPQPRKAKHLKDIPAGSNVQPDPKHSGVL